MGERFQADRGGPGFQRPVSVKVVVGGAAGRVLGMRSARYVESLLYQVKAAEPDIAALPALAILSVAVVAILPAISGRCGSSLPRFCVRNSILGTPKLRIAVRPNVRSRAQRPRGMRRAALADRIGK
jgi:hypothetical protein